MFIDCSYRCSSGTCFYNREKEIEWLIDRVYRSAYVIVWGPRNIGKSELLKYLSWRLGREGFCVIYIDCREAITSDLVTIHGFRDMTELFREAIELIGLGKLSKAYDLVSSVVRRVRASGVLWVFDEAHRLNGYDRVLEVLIKKTIYTFHEKPFSTIISSSEGWFIRSNVVYSLREYGAQDLLVESMDKEVFIEYARELFRVYGRSPDVPVDILYNEFISGNPGYLVKLLSYRSVEEWIESVREWFIEVVNRVSIETGISVRDYLRFISSTPMELNALSLDPVVKRVMDKLMEYNIVYYVLKDTMYHVKPQLPVYRKIAIELLDRLHES